MEAAVILKDSVSRLAQHHLRVVVVTAVDLSVFHQIKFPKALALELEVVHNLAEELLAIVVTPDKAQVLVELAVMDLQTTAVEVAVDTPVVELQ